MPAGRTIAIGDVHGCDAALERLLALVEPTGDDTVVLLGDLCDRGPDTRRVIDRLIGLSRRCDLKVILGNHDEMMLDALGALDSGVAGDPAFWESVGGRETLASYGGRPGDVPREHVEFLRAALPCWEDDATIFVHAAVDPDLPLAEQSIEALRWRKIAGDERPHSSGKRVLCGHTSQRSGRPLAWDGWVCLDSRVFDTGWLTGFDTGADTVFQAHQDGETRGPAALAEFASRQGR